MGIEFTRVSNAFSTFGGFLIYNAEVCCRFYDFGAPNIINVYDIDSSDSNEPSPILSGNNATFAQVLASGNKYIYSRRIFSSSYKQY